MNLPLRVLSIMLLLLVALMTFARREDSGRIAYVSTLDYSPYIFLMTGDGEAVQQITQGDICGVEPRWSPDGMCIAFMNPCSATKDWLRVPLAGSKPQLLYTAMDHTEVQWSPDLQRLLVTLQGLYHSVVELTTRGERPLAEDFTRPQWSPDGKWIYALPRASDESSLSRIHVTTGQVEPLLPSDSVFTNPSWSPDAAQIVLAMPTDDGDALFLINPDGSDLTMIPVDLPEPRIFEPRWSPDGEWIAFLGGQSAFSLSIFRVRPNGRDLERLTQHTGNLSELNWSPDGDWLLFVERYQFREDIFRLAVDYPRLENLTLGPGTHSEPQYAPVSGVHWHPLSMVVAALGMVAISFVWRFRR